MDNDDIIAIIITVIILIGLCLLGVWILTRNPEEILENDIKEGIYVNNHLAIGESATRQKAPGK